MPSRSFLFELFFLILFLGLYIFMTADFFLFRKILFSVDHYLIKIIYLGIVSLQLLSVDISSAKARTFRSNILWQSRLVELY